MNNNNPLLGRQAAGGFSGPSAIAGGGPNHCTAFVLPSNGIISLASSAITLTTDVIFKPQCSGQGVTSISTVDVRALPFYASSIPQTYVVATATVIAWILLLMLIVTSRFGFTGAAAGLPGFGGGHGIIGGGRGGGSSLAGIGSRPWLQKVATMTVAIGLALATAGTFNEAKSQYEDGVENALQLRETVLGSLEIRITRLVSDIFLWLAQVQTLVRLFPRHKEKVLIKWIGFALILCDTAFACVNVSLVQHSGHPPGQFDDAIPALLYLFELALGLLYAAWVMYYSLTKRRYAFYHEKMKSICLIALLSLVAVLVPVVFFVMDVSNSAFATWGDYARWVGAAAASVVVWEWVERIEGLERDERRDGILGREVFDGDEMFDPLPSDDVIWTGSRRQRQQLKRQGDDGEVSASDSTAKGSSSLEKGFDGLKARLRNKPKPLRSHFPLGRKHSEKCAVQQLGVEAPRPQEQLPATSVSFAALPKPTDQHDARFLGRPTPPPAIASPVSRTETTSAASTVYVVRYHQPDSVGFGRQGVDASTNSMDVIREMQHAGEEQAPKAGTVAAEKEQYDPADDDASQNHDRSRSAWYAVANPFKRKRTGLPREVEAATTASRAAEASLATSCPMPPAAQHYSRWDIKNRLGALAAETGEKLRERNVARKVEHEEESPVVVIPAPIKGSGRVWTPEEHRRAQARTDSSSSSAQTGLGSSPTFGAQPPNGSSPTANGTVRSTTSAAATSPQSTALSEPDRSRAMATASSPISQASSPRSSRPQGNTQDASSQEEIIRYVPRGSEVPRPESLTPPRGGNGPVVIPAPKRVKKTSPPLATQCENSPRDEG